jgi:methyl-accepting chemotaxis protein
MIDTGYFRNYFCDIGNYKGINRAFNLERKKEKFGQHLLKSVVRQVNSVVRQVNFVVHQVNSVVRQVNSVVRQVNFVVRLVNSKINFKLKF